MEDHPSRSLQVKRYRRSRHIAFDIVINILPRLPVCSLARFRHVCNPWRNFLSDPAFLSPYLEHARRKALHPPAGFILFSQDSDYQSARMDDAHVSLLDESMELKHIITIPGNGYYLRMTPPCNGLVCIYDDKGNSVQLLNPTTGEQRSLPPASSDSSALWFHLGFHPLTKEYKVVRWFNRHLRCRSDYLCEVLTLGTLSSWRQIGYSENIELYGWGDDDPVTVDGIMYLLTCTYIQGAIFVIKSFDLRHECFRTIPFPDDGGHIDLQAEDSFTRLFQLGGSLWVIADNGNYLDLCMLEDAQTCAWIRKYHLSMSPQVKSRWGNVCCRMQPGEFFSHCKPMFICSKDVLIARLDEQICHFDLGSEERKYQVVYTEKHLKNAHAYVGSLVSLGQDRLGLDPSQLLPCLPPCSF